MKFVDRLKIHLGNLQGMNFAEILGYFGLSARRFVKRRQRPGDKVVRAQSQTDAQAKELRDQLVRAYKPEPYDGAVTLFSVTKRPWFIRWDPMEQWNKILTGPLEIVAIPGDHMSMLQPPQVGILADAIRAILQKNETA